FDLAARDEDPAVGSAELDAVMQAVWAGVTRDRCAVPLIIVGGDAMMAHAIRVGVFDAIFAESVEAIGNHLYQRLAFDAYRPAGIEPQAPQCDVIVMRAPVGHGAAGVVVPIAEGHVRALGNVGNFGRLAEPEIPVETWR